MNEQTERLDNRLRNMSFHLEEDDITEILLVCLEAGLKFVGAELKLPPIKNPNAQIDEIEL